MGEILVLGFGGLSLVALALIAFGALRRSRPPLLAGCTILLALAGAWVFGPPGVLVGALPFLALLHR